MRAEPHALSTSSVNIDRRERFRLLRVEGQSKSGVGCSRATRTLCGRRYPVSWRSAASGGIAAMMRQSREPPHTRFQRRQQLQHEFVIPGDLWIQLPTIALAVIPFANADSCVFHAAVTGRILMLASVSTSTPSAGAQTANKHAEKSRSRATNETMSGATQAEDNVRARVLDKPVIFERRACSRKRHTPSQQCDCYRS